MFNRVTGFRRIRGPVGPIVPALDQTPPAVVQNFVAIAGGATTINTSWNPTTDTGGSGLLRYNIQEEGRIRSIAGITQANPGVFSTSGNHDLSNGDKVIIDPRSSPETSISHGGAGDYPLHRKNVHTVTVLSPTTFHLSVDTTSFPAYTSGGHIGRIIGGGQVNHPTVVLAVNGLQPATLYRYYCSAEDGAGNIAAASVADGATTDSLPSSDYWEESTGTATPPFLPGLAGYGATCFGGSGRHAPSGGLAAPSTIFICNNASQLASAIGTNGLPKTIIITTNGIFDYNESQFFDLRQDYITLVDLSPAPGCMLKGTSFAYFSNKHIGMVNIRCYCKTTDPSYAAFNGVWLTVEDGPNRTEDCVIAFCTGAYSSDTMVNWYWKTNNTCFYGNIFMNPLNVSFHPESPHGSTVILGWYDTQQHVSLYRNILANSLGRGPLSGARHLDNCDNLMLNFQNEGTTAISQNGSPPTTGFPSQVNNQNNLYVRGPQTFFSLNYVSIGFPGEPHVPHAGSLIHSSGNEQIGYTASPGEVNFSPLSLQGSRVAGGAGPGYVPTPIGTSLTEKRARGAEICSYAGAWRNNRLPQEADFITKCLNNINQTGSNLGSIIDEGDQDYSWSGTPGTSNFVGAGAEGGDPAPGWTAMTTGGFAAPTAWRTIQPSGWTAGEEWIHRRLAARGIVVPA